MATDMIRPRERLIFTEPMSLDEAEQRAEECLSRIRAIEIALSDPNKTDESGNRISGQEYFTWRHRAVVAKMRITETYRKYKVWIKRHHVAHVAMEAGVSDPSNVSELLVAALKALTRISREYHLLTLPEQRLMSAIRNQLQRGYTAPEA